MDNPFKPGNGISPPYLAGRDDEITYFSSSLEEAIGLPQNLVISGVRGTGKTVLLREFERIAEKKKWLFVRREFNRKLSDENLLVQTILLDIAIKAKGVSIVKEFSKPTIGFKSVKSVEVGKDFIYHLLEKYPGTLGDRLEAILKEVSGIITAAGFNGLVFLYDEFHSVEDDKTKKNLPTSLLLEAFSHLQQEGKRFYLVLSGLPPLFSNLVKAKTYAERMFSVKNLTYLSSEAAEKAITIPLKGGPWSFSKDLVQNIIKETKGYPYFIQFFCYYLIKNIPRHKLDSFGLKEMHPFLIKELDESFYKGRFEKASDTEIKILTTMAKLGAEIEVSKLKRKSGLSTNYLNQILIALTEKGLIFRSKRGRYAFALPLFEKFILRSH